MYGFLEVCVYNYLKKTAWHEKYKAAQRKIDVITGWLKPVYFFPVSFMKELI